MRGHPEEARSSWARRPRRVARSRDCWVVPPCVFLRDAARHGWRASECHSVLALMATAPATFNRLGIGEKIAQARNDPKRGARLQGAAPPSTNRGVTRTDPAESRQAPIADRERRRLQAPALRTPTPSGTSCILLTSSLPAGGGPTRSHRNAKRPRGE